MNVWLLKKSLYYKLRIGQMKQYINKISYDHQIMDGKLIDNYTQFIAYIRWMN